LETQIKYYFDERLGDLSLQQLYSRINFLGGAQGGEGSTGGGSSSVATSNALGSAAKEMMSRSGRKAIPLNELIGVT